MYYIYIIVSLALMRSDSCAMFIFLCLLRPVYFIIWKPKKMFLEKYETFSKKYYVPKKFQCRYLHVTLLNEKRDYIFLCWCITNCHICRCLKWHKVGELFDHVIFETNNMFKSNFLVGKFNCTSTKICCVLLYLHISLNFNIQKIGLQKSKF